MKKLEDQALIQYYCHKYKFEDIFLQIPELQAFAFEKNEILNQKLNPIDFISFLVEGKIHLRSIRKDGSIYEISNLTPFTCLGDMEFLQDHPSQHDIITDTDCIFLVIPCSKYKELLKKDYLFLQFLIRSITEKFTQASNIYANQNSLKNRLLEYAKMNHNIISNIEKTAQYLCCSRRQLQRVLVQLCDEGQLTKVQRGIYLLK